MPKNKSTAKNSVPKKKQKTEKDAPKLKRPASSYMLYCKARRPELKKEQPTLSFGEFGKALGADWRKLGDDDKKPFEKEAAKLKQTYLKEKAKLDGKGGGKGKGGAKGKGGKADKAPKKPSQKLKRPASSYMLFCKKHRPEVKKKKPTLTFGELGKEMGADWRKLGEDDKKPFAKEAAKLKKKYLKEKAKLEAIEKAEEKEKEEEEEEEESEEEDDDDEEEEEGSDNEKDASSEESSSQSDDE